MSFFLEHIIFRAHFFLPMISQDWEAWGYTAEGIGGRLGPRSLYRAVPATVRFYPPAVPCLDSCGFPFLSGENTEICLQSTAKLRMHPGDCLKARSVCLAPFITPHVADMMSSGYALVMVSSSESGLVHTSSSLLSGSTDMPSSFLVDPSQKLASISCVSLWILSSGGTAHRSW